MTQVHEGLELRGQSAFPASQKVYADGSRPDIRGAFPGSSLDPHLGPVRARGQSAAAGL